MDTKLKEAKQIIRAFMRDHYTDERLAMLLAHAQSGRLSFFSCCCFIGIPTADHALMGTTNEWHQPHYLKAKYEFVGASNAEAAFLALGNCKAQQVRRLVSIIRAEIKRRDHLRIESSNCDRVAALSQQATASVS